MTRLQNCPYDEMLDCCPRFGREDVFHTTKGGDSVETEFIYIGVFELQNAVSGI